MNCRLGYCVVGWALRPCNRSYNLNTNCRVGYLLEDGLFAHVKVGEMK